MGQSVRDRAEVGQQVTQGDSKRFSRRGGPGEQSIGCAGEEPNAEDPAASRKLKGEGLPDGRRQPPGQGFPVEGQDDVMTTVRENGQAPAGEVVDFKELADPSPQHCTRRDDSLMIGSLGAPVAGLTGIVRIDWFQKYPFHKTPS